MVIVHPLPNISKKVVEFLVINEERLELGYGMSDIT
jgi:hypothetical protein